VDGVELRRAVLPRGVWHCWSLKLPASRPDAASCCFELRLVSEKPRTDILDPSLHLEVRSVALGAAAAAETTSLSSHTTLAALLRASGGGPVSLAVGSQVEASLAVIGRLVAQGVKRLAIVSTDAVWSFLSWHPNLERSTAGRGDGGLFLLAGMTDADAPPDAGAGAWRVSVDGVAVRADAGPWPDAQLAVPTPFDEERRQWMAKVAKAGAKLAEARERSAKLKEKYEAARQRRPNWLQRLLRRRPGGEA
jgi:hypothetical protein